MKSENQDDAAEENCTNRDQRWAYLLPSASGETRYRLVQDAVDVVRQFSAEREDGVGVDLLGESQHVQETVGSGTRHRPEEVDEAESQ